jgi:hypothetical protein
VDHGRLIGCGTLETLRRQAAVDGSLEEVFLTLTEPGGGAADGNGAPHDGRVKPLAPPERTGPHP